MFTKMFTLPVIVASTHKRIRTEIMTARRRCWTLNALLMLPFVSISTRAFTAVSTRTTSRPFNRQGVVSLFATLPSLASNSTTSTTTTTTSSNNHLTPLQPAVPTKQESTTLKSRLRADLRQYRTQQSTALRNKRAYNVFANAVLEEICDTLPTTHQELLAVKGIGPRKLKNHGDDILAIVAQYTDANGSLRKVIADSSPQQEQQSRPPRPVLIDPNTLNDEQRRAAKLLLSSTRPNGFVTGSAGTGKSHVLKYVVQQLQHGPKQGRRVVGVCAPTGVAAIHVGGSTLHSFFGIGLVFYFFFD